MTPIIYSTKNCSRCMIAKRFMTDRGIPFTEKYVDQDEEAMNLLKSLGFKQVPIIQTETEWIEGFNPVKLGALT